MAGRVALAVGDDRFLALFFSPARFRQNARSRRRAHHLETHSTVHWRGP